MLRGTDSNDASLQVCQSVAQLGVRMKISPKKAIKDANTAKLVGFYSIVKNKKAIMMLIKAAKRGHLLYNIFYANHEHDQNIAIMTELSQLSVELKFSGCYPSPTACFQQ